MRSYFPGYRALLGVIVASCLAACSSGGGNVTPPPDEDRDLGMQSGDDGSVSREDLSGRDLAGVDLRGNGNIDMTTTTGLPCTPGAYRCGASNTVEICNSTGSAWLYTATCTVACSAGLCTGACSPGARRCNTTNVEECNTSGTTWNKVDTCAGSCSSGKCALVSLDVTMNQNLDGEIVVDGDAIIHSGATVTSPTGNLTIRAKNITVESTATITVAAIGNSLGQAPTSTSSDYGGGGGGNGTGGSNGGSSTYGPGGSVIGVDTDMDVQPGGNGGNGAPPYGGNGGRGGGVLRLIAGNDISVAGFLTANGTAGTANTSSYYQGGGGGAGGSILLAASGKISVTGTVSTAAGAGGTGYNRPGGAGGQGRVKILSGDTRTITGTVNGHRNDALLPPLLITSSSHPNSSLTYNDGFDSVELAWTSPFASRQCYYHLMNTAYSQVPKTTDTYDADESTSYPRTAVGAGSNYFHIVVMDALAVIGTVENRFLIQVNSTPVTISSDSHSSSSTWYPNPAAHFLWSLPYAASQQGVYYEFDHFGDTMPTKASTFIPVTNTTLLRSSLTDGIWVMHMVAMDKAGYLTRSVQHFRINVGATGGPGDGSVTGTVQDSMGTAVSSAVVTINRGLWSTSTLTTGSYTFNTVSAGTYELRVTPPGKSPTTQMITVNKGMLTTANVSLP